MESDLAAYGLAQCAGKQANIWLDLCLVVLVDDTDGTCRGDGDASSSGASAANQPSAEEALELVVELEPRKVRERVKVFVLRAASDGGSHLRCLRRGGNQCWSSPCETDAV